MCTCMPMCRCVHMSTDTCAYQSIECGAGIPGISKMSHMGALSKALWFLAKTVRTLHCSVISPASSLLRTSMLSQMQDMLNDL